VLDVEDDRDTHIDIINVCRRHLAILVLWEHVVTTREWCRPMHEVEVEIVRVKIFQGRITSFLDVVGVVRVVP
jgi:hypothetical protein